MSKQNLLSVYDRVTQKIVADLERGVLPWQKPWNGSNAAPYIVCPLRHGGEPYKGVNILLLWDAAMTGGYQNPTWMTFKQAQDYGAHVRKGEEGALVVIAKSIVKSEIDKETGLDIEREIPFLRGYTVFNVEQIEGLPEKFLWKSEVPAVESKIKRVENVEAFISNTGAVIKHGGDRAYYSGKSDHIQMPHIEAFRDRESYYATLGHETIHWTKHESRLNRDFGRIKWGDEGYAKEELVAEIGSAFLCAELGITPEVREDHAAYIDSWLKALKEDKKFIFTAAAHATRAAQFLKDKQPQPTMAPQTEPEADRPVSVMTDGPLYISKPMQIGKHLWRMKIDHFNQTSLCTRYEFQDKSGSFWHPCRDWPRYDINDTYLGLPQTLSKLYEREQPALIKHGLVTPKPTKQMSLSF